MEAGVRGWVWALFIVLGAGLARAEDTAAPVIRHKPVLKATEGETVTIRAKITDASAIFSPTLYFRAAGTKPYASTQLTPEGGNSYVGRLAATSDLEYWLDCFDEFGNGPTREASPEKPHRIQVKRAKAAPPPVVRKDMSPPVIRHTPIASARVGEKVTVSAVIEDASQLFDPRLHVRRVGEVDFASGPLVLKDGTWDATVEVTGPFEYWLETYDEWGNGPATAGSAAAPFRVLTLEPAPAAVATTAEPPAVAIDERVLDPSASKRTWIIAGAAGGAVAVGIGVLAYVLQPSPYIRYSLTDSSSRR